LQKALAVFHGADDFFLQSRFQLEMPIF